MGRKILELKISKRSIFVDLNLIYAIDDIFVIPNSGMCVGFSFNLGIIALFTDTNIFKVNVFFAHFGLSPFDKHEKISEFESKVQKFRQDLIDVWSGEIDTNKISIE